MSTFAIYQCRDNIPQGREGQVDFGCFLQPLTCSSSLGLSFWSLFQTRLTEKQKCRYTSNCIIFWPFMCSYLCQQESNIDFAIICSNGKAERGIMTFSHGLKFKMTGEISLSTNRVLAINGTQTYYVSLMWLLSCAKNKVLFTSKWEKWYWQLCVCSKGLQLGWIWCPRDLQGGWGCMSEGVLSLQTLWICMYSNYLNSFLDISFSNSS